MHASELTLLLNLGFIVITAAVFAFLGKAIRMPSIVAYILAGITLGPVLGLVELSHSLELIAEVGIALLLFLVGLELSFAKIRDVGKVAIVAGLGQVVFTALGGLGLCLLLGFDFLSALFLSVALTFSSTVVVVKLLDQKGELGRLYGRIAVGIFLVQDLVVIGVLTLLTGLQVGGSFEIQAILIGLGKAIGGMLLLLAVTLLASRYVLPKPFAWAARSQDTSFIWALLLVLPGNGTGRVDGALGGGGRIPCGDRVGAAALQRRPAPAAAPADEFLCGDFLRHPRGADESWGGAGILGIGGGAFALRDHRESVDFPDHYHADGLQ